LPPARSAPIQAAALRNFVEMQRSQPAVDEEQFRFITGFNDIFVSHRRGDPARRGGLDRPVDRRSAGLAVEGDGPSFLAPAAVAAKLGPRLFFTAKANGASLDPPSPRLRRIGVHDRGIRLVLALGPDRLDDNTLSPE
jgi:hypothetical protein